MGRCRLVICFLVIALHVSRAAFAQDVTPTIVDFRTQAGRLSIEIQMHPNRLSQLKTAPSGSEAETGDAETLLRRQVVGWLETFAVTADRPLLLTLQRVTSGGETAQRVYVSYQAPLPEQVQFISFYWPSGAGEMVLRQHGVPDPFSGYFVGGQATHAIALGGGAARSDAETVMNYMPVGFQKILSLGGGYVLLALAVFLKSGRRAIVVGQVFAVLLAQVAVFALVSFKVPVVVPDLGSWGVLALVVVLSVDNILFRRLHFLRFVLVFLFGALHSFQFAGVLQNIGWPTAEILPALVGYSLGADLAFGLVITGAFLLVGMWFGHRPKYRGRVIIPASITLVGIALYLGVEGMPV